MVRHHSSCQGNAAIALLLLTQHDAAALAVTTVHMSALQHTLVLLGISKNKLWRLHEPQHAPDCMYVVAAR